MKLSIDINILCILIELFHVVNDDTMKKFSKFFVFAAKKLEKNRNDNSCRYNVLLSHYFKTGDKGHSDFCVKNTIILLE